VTSTAKYCLQDAQYEFPYHYLPQLERDVTVRLGRYLPWGLDYVTYMTFIGDLLRERRPESLLDVGCGDGRLAHLVKADIPNVCGVDLSERAIAFARAFNPDVDFICADISTLTRRYACLTLIEVLEHISDEAMEGFVQTLSELVEDDGHVLISVPTVNLPLNKKHYRHYDRELLEATLAPHFVVDQYWWLYRRGIWERCITSALANRAFILNLKPLQRMIWRIHKRLTYHADAASGAHLVCWARRKGHRGRDA